MKTGESWDLKHLSDDELLRKLQSVRNAERSATVLVVAHLAEVERRRLQLRTGSSSLFDYCVRRLGMSGNEAFRRVTAARLAQRFPLILELLAKGDIHLCAISELRDYLTLENHAELLAEACGKTRKQVQMLVARRHPRPDVASSIRKLPAPKQVSVEVVSTTPAATAPPTATGAEVVAPTTPPLLPPDPPLSPGPAQKPRTLLEPLREDCYRLQLNTTAELKRKLELARDLTSHSNPKGDFAIVVERALDVLIDKLQRERFAQATRPRPQAPPKPDRRQISNATKRAVVERDGLQCSYVSPNGERCANTQFLQFHHVHPWARGGASTPENIKIYCFAHNQLQAEQDFGREHIVRAIEEAGKEERDAP